MNATLQCSEVTGLPSLNLEMGTEQLVVLTRWPSLGMSIAIGSLRHADIQHLHDVMEEWLKDEAFEGEAILRREEAEARAG